MEDDPVTRLLYTHELEKQGYEVLQAGTGVEARELVNSIPLLEAVLVDYFLPDGTGVEVLEWLYSRDATLASVIMTGMGKKELVAESLRVGATAFLDKPVSRENLRRETAKAVARTRKFRNLARMASEIETIGHAMREYQRLALSQTRDLSIDIEFRSYPRHEAGGDFLVCSPTADGGSLVISLDTSGHDLVAASTVSFYTGIFAGMTAARAPVPQILAHVNSLLSTSSQIHISQGPGLPKSASICALVFRDGSVEVTCGGSPQPILVESDGTLRRIGEPSEPLGWFGNTCYHSSSYAMSADSHILVWTDGLEDLAEHLRIDPLSLAYSLESTPAGAHLDCLDASMDDIMVANIAWKEGERLFRPILAESYECGDLEYIDVFQAKWKRSILHALPKLDDQSIHDVLLICREAVINAIQHGCARGGVATMHLCHNRTEGLMRIILSDPGSGHDFQWNEMDESVDLAENHRGLLLIHSLARQVRSTRKGAHLLIDCDTRFTRL